MLDHGLIHLPSRPASLWLDVRAVHIMATSSWPVPLLRAGGRSGLPEVPWSKRCRPLAPAGGPLGQGYPSPEPCSQDRQYGTPPRDWLYRGVVAPWRAKAGSESVLQRCLRSALRGCPPAGVDQGHLWPAGAGQGDTWPAGVGQGRPSLAGGDQGHPLPAGVGQGRPWPSGRFSPWGIGPLCGDRGV